VLVGCATNVSKIGQFLAVVIIMAFCILAGRRVQWDRGRLNRGRAALGTVYAHSLIDFPLQIFAIQLTVNAWAAIAIGETDGPQQGAPDPDPVRFALPAVTSGR
jgi:hypothetical protein